MAAATTVARSRMSDESNVEAVFMLLECCVCVLGRGCCGSRVSAVLAVLVLAPFYPSLAEFCKRGADWPSMRKAFECHKCLHNLPLVLYNCKYIIGNQMLINNDIGAQRNA